MGVAKRDRAEAGGPGRGVLRQGFPLRAAADRGGPADPPRDGRGQDRVGQPRLRPERVPGPDGARRLRPLLADGTGLQKEFSELVIEAAKENRWNLMGIPKITLRGGRAHAEGRVQGRGRPSRLRRTQGRARVSTRRTRPRRPEASPSAISLDTAERLEMSEREPQLLVLDQRGKPSREHLRHA